jgi:hypothetical protein
VSDAGDIRTMTVELDGGRSAFAPGERVEGQAAWELPEPPRALEVRLFWSTSGRGDEDQEVVAVEEVPSPGASGWMRFSFVLPPGPYSFSGRLVSLTWSIELVAPHEKMAGGTPLVVGPERREVRIDGEPPPAEQ